MKTFMKLLIMAAFVTAIAPAVLAQATPATPATGGTNWLPIAGAFGMALAAAGCGYAQSRVAAAACEGMARNPGAAEPIRAAMFLGLVFVETLALFTFVVVLLLKFVA